MISQGLARIVINLAARLVVPTYIATPYLLKVGFTSSLRSSPAVTIH